MPRLTPLFQVRVPLGGQEIELQQVDFEAGGMSLVRTRIREKSRFTIFDVDPLTAQAWGEALLRWARSQPPGVGRGEVRHEVRGEGAAPTNDPA
jgi:hypothetical protein